MKKPLALLLSLLMLFSLTACGGGGNNQPASDGNQSRRNHCSRAEGARQRHPQAPGL